MATSAIAVLVLAATPALAAAGTFKVSRSLILEGDRDGARVDLKMIDSAPKAELKVQFGFGSYGANAGVILAQEGGDNASRLVKAYVSGDEARAEAAGNCTTGDGATVTCRRGGYDWVKGREYRVAFIRGGVTQESPEASTFRHWTVKITDRVTGEATELLQFSVPYNKMSAGTGDVNDTNGMPVHHASLQVGTNDCAQVPSVEAVVEKPVGEGTVFTWGDADRARVVCDGGRMGAPLSNGAARFFINDSE